MLTSTVRTHKLAAVCGQSLRAKGLLALITLAVSIGSTAPVRGQDPPPANSTALNDWVQDARDDATHDAIEFLFDNVTLEPSSIEWGKTVNSDNLQMASWQRVFSALSVWSYAEQLDSTQAKIESARAAARDLQSQLTQARNITGSRQSASIVEIESNLKQVNFTLQQATADQGYLESRLASAESDLRQAQGEIRSAQRGLIYFNQGTPRGDFAVGFAQQALPWIGLGQEGFTLAANPVLQNQRNEYNYQATKFAFDLGSTIAMAVDEGLADIIAPPAALYDLHEKLHDLQLALNAQAHQRESEGLTFSGVLSTANLPKVQFIHDYDNFSGSFRSTQTSGRLSVTGAWVSTSDSTFDRFSAASRYTFSGLETPSGHILTGYGIASRDRVEQHDPFFDLLSVFDFRNNQAVTETTRRHESYNDSFNGALANQNIRRAIEFNPHPIISAAPSATLFYDQENVKRPPPPSLPPPPCRGIDPGCLPQKETTKKRPPSIFPQPLPPPRPIPVALDDEESFKRAPSVIIPPASSPPPKPDVSGKSAPVTGGVYLGGEQKYSDHKGTDKQFDKELEGAEVVPAKKKQQPQ